jgi:hypothetical protein
LSILAPGILKNTTRKCSPECVSNACHSHMRTSDKKGNNNR